MEGGFEQRLDELNRQIDSQKPSAHQLSRRGDLLFFLGRFLEAVADYSEMARIVPNLDASHWRRGLALYYAGNFADAAAQFERCYGVDNVDRENGIWHFLSRCRLVGVKKARQEMLSYKTPDREPLDDLYQLFQGTISKEDVLERIQGGAIAEEERQGRLFYAHLYIGLNELIQERPAAARTFLQRGVESNWPLDAGYGPQYMWQIARLQLARIPPSQ
jgi:lipoprotein NlpI